MKTCPYCAEQIQDAAVICKHCGRDLTAAASTPAPPRKRALTRMRPLLLALVGLVLILVVLRLPAGGAGARWAPLAAFRTAYHAQIADGSEVGIPSGGYRDWSFKLPNRTCHLTGHLVGTAGGNLDFRAALLDDDNFRNWTTNHPARAYWQTGQVAAATLDATVTGLGPYHLVVSNAFSMVTDKRVTVQAEVLCP